MTEWFGIRDFNGNEQTRSVASLRWRPPRRFLLFAAAIALVQSCATSFAIPALGATVPDAGLPDGRAYEQVSPAEKNGSNVAGKVSQISAAPDGDAINFFVAAGIPGGDGAQEYPSYVARRSATGWATEGMLPPASSGAATAQVLGWNPNFSEAFIKMSRSLTEPSSLQSMTLPGDEALPVAEIGTSATSFSAVSSDGELVVFQSKQKVGTTAGLQGKSNVYAWDRATGEVSLVSVTNAGASASSKGSFPGAYDWFATATTTRGGSERRDYLEEQHAVSSNGDAVVFTTSAATPQVYVRLNPTEPQSALGAEGECLEAGAGCTVEASASHRQSPDPEGEQAAQFQFASADGSQVFFTSAAKLTDDATTGPADEGSDLYRYEPATDTLTDLTPDTEPLDPAGAEVLGVLGASEGADYVYFAANGILADGGTHGTCGPLRGLAEGITGECNLYVWHDGQIGYVAPLELGGGSEVSDIQDWAPTPLTAGNATNPSTARVTPDGHALVFRSQEKLTSYENAGIPEFYRYVYGQAGVQCLSCDPRSTPPVAAPSLSSLTAQRTPVAPAAQKSRNLATSGDRFFFESSEALVEGDTNGTTDVYEWEAPGSGSCSESDQAYASQDGGCLYLISTGTGLQPSFFADASEDGRDAFFYTAQQLVAQDKDELVDVYDAREGGGIAGQDATEPEPCSGEACKGGGATPPLQPAPQNAAAVDAGNVTPVKCRKGSVNRHGRCVKRKPRKKHHRRHHHRHKAHKKNAGGRSGSGNSK